MEQNDLVPVGHVVKHTESYIQERRRQWGGGWSDRDRENFKRWEAELREVRWTVVEHLPPMSEHNRGWGWAYKLQNEAGNVSFSLPGRWEDA